MNAKIKSTKHKRNTDQADILRVQLTSYDPGNPPRSTVMEPDSQCDCTCLSIAGTELPLLDLPVSFYLELTPLCNNRCPSCGNVFADRTAADPMPPAMSAQDWEQILTRIAPTAQRLKVTGGEPTLHPEFEAIMESIDRLGIPFTLFTNGRWRDPDRTCRYLRRLNRLDGLLVSLHGPDASSHEAFTHVPGSFAETQANIRRAVAAGLPVSLSCVLTHLNWDRVSDMLHLAYELGAESVVFNRYLGADPIGLAPAPAALQVAIGAISNLRASGEPVKLGNCVPQCFASTGQTGCLAGLAFLTVDPWGRARPCNHATMICGDLRRQSLAEVWHSTTLAAWRDFRPEPCQGCSAFAICRGGCKAQAFACGLGIDPLLESPASLTMPQRRQRFFYEQARPIGRFERTPQHNGTLLLRGSRLALVQKEAHPLLDMLDGQTTLQQVEQVHGMAGLGLIAALYEQNLIDLA